MTDEWTVRSPFPDELPRVLRMLPRTPQQQSIRIAVTGRVERIGAAAVLYLSDAPGATGLLRFTPGLSQSAPEVIVRILMPLVDEARQSGASEVILVGSVAEDHPLAPLLLKAGFEAYRQNEVYSVSVETVLERVEAVYRRMNSRGMIPASARAIVPRGPWIGRLREFLDRQQRPLSDQLEVEEGYSLDHSLILLVEDAIRGVFFTRNRGKESYIGMMLLDPELRGGLAWANALMMREMLQFGRFIGVERLIGEVHAKEHAGSRFIAQASGAELIYRRWQFRQRFRA